MLNLFKFQKLNLKIRTSLFFLDVDVKKVNKTILFEVIKL